MDCIHKGDQHEEFETCFKKIRNDDLDEEPHDKCATCVCKLLERFPHFNLTGYPSIKDMFCFRGNKQLQENYFLNLHCVQIIDKGMIN